MINLGTLSHPVATMIGRGIVRPMRIGTLNRRYTDIISGLLEQWLHDIVAAELEKKAEHTNDGQGNDHDVAGKADMKSASARRHGEDLAFHFTNKKYQQNNKAADMNRYSSLLCV